MFAIGAPAAFSDIVFEKRLFDDYEAAVHIQDLNHYEVMPHRDRHKHKRFLEKSKEMYH
jgi:hypothetical protein